MMAHAPIPLLFNPKAGSLHRTGFNAWLRRNARHFRLEETSSAAELTARAKALAEQGEPVVAAAGGDGTLMNAAAGLIGSGTTLGILPCGTMNVFARELGIGSRRFDIAHAAMLGGMSREVDVFSVNGKPFLQMASFGLDARIVQLITPTLKQRLGAAAHLVTAFQVMKERAPLITLTLPDGEQLTGSELILGNGRRYAGAPCLFAGASLDDGMLDAVIFSKGRISVLCDVLGYMLRQGVTEQNARDSAKLRRFRKAYVSADSPLAFQLDGDYAGTLRPGEKACIDMLPERLNVCIPC